MYTFFRASLIPGNGISGSPEIWKDAFPTITRGVPPHTSRFMPWKIVVSIRFEDDDQAARFERYLKAGSGHAFASKHLW